MPAVKTVRKPKPIKPEEKAALKAQAFKRLAELSLYEFVRQAWHVLEPDQQFVTNWHITAIAEHLEAVTDGRINNLLCNVPPGTMKSLLVSVFWPAWVWTTQPQKRFLASSYAEDLSMRDSQRCRRLLASEWYQSRWPIRFSDSQDTKGKFENIRGGWRMVGSVTGKGTGEHPDFNILDDPHNVIKAESDAERKTVTDWVEAVFATRGVVRDVRRVVIMQRLHALDASGVLLAKGGWVHICLPNRFEQCDVTVEDGQERQTPRMRPTPLGWTDPRKTEGELLWPAKYDKRKTDELEASMGLYHAAGQLQQRPSPRGGGKFKREWFQIMTVLPPLRRLIRYWDKAGTKGGTGAQTAGCLMGEYQDDTAALVALKTKYVIINIIAGRWEAAEREAIILQTAHADKALYRYVENWVEEEPGSGGKESAQATIANLAGFTCFAEKVTGSKEVRAEPMASQASVGKIKLLKGFWNAQFLEEAEQFPVGKLKDFIDGASGAFNKLCAVGGGFSSASELHTGTSRELGDTSDRIDFRGDRLGRGDM